ncbi:MAG: PEP-CTERM sorting domain-containing protein, partial [Burkholderiales bacterium]|nr:PEP-CTERM sorting domain-containing protein [Burkholderiales bacterium]
QAPISIDYRAFNNSSPFATIATGTLTRVAFRFTEDIELDGEEIGHLYDFVFRDSRDDKLVFGMRTRLGVEDDHDDDSELNFLYRYCMTEGATVFAPSAAWLFVSDSDLRAYSAGSTASDALTGDTLYDADTVRFQSDINLEEGNPDSGLFLVKTDAMFWRTVDRAIGVFQAGEEGQPRVGSDFAGFAPSAVPEPSTWALSVLGMAGALALVRRRRTRT